MLKGLLLKVDWVSAGSISDLFARLLFHTSLDDVGASGVILFLKIATQLIEVGVTMSMLWEPSEHIMVHSLDCAGQAEQ